MSERAMAFVFPPRLQLCLNPGSTPQGPRTDTPRDRDAEDRASAAHRLLAAAGGSQESQTRSGRGRRVEPESWVSQSSLQQDSQGKGAGFSFWASDYSLVMQEVFLLYIMNG